MENEDYIEEKQLRDHPKSLSKQQNKIILDYMEKCVCKINLENGDKATGTFCKIPFPDLYNLLPVLITNNHVLNENDILPEKNIHFTLNNDKKEHKISLKKRKTLTMIKPYDITIIEIKKYDGLDINSFLEIDTNIYKEKLKEIYTQKTIILIHYPKGGEVKYSLGVIRDISEINIQNFCDSEPGSSGGPLININNLKLIGIHKGGKDNNNYNLGTLIKHPIENFIKINKNCELKKNSVNNALNNNFENEMIIEYKLEGNLINKLFSNKIKIFGDNFVKNNEKNCKIIIDGKEYELCSIFKTNLFNLNQNRLIIKLIGLEKIKNMSSMFEGCESLLSLSNISNLNTINVINMSKMFSGCSSLKSLPNLSKWNTINVEDMSEMFKGCKILSYLEGISEWDTSNVTNMREMFSYCNFKYLPNLSKWNTNKVKDMSSIFLNCINLYYLPDLSNWNFDFEKNYEFYFKGCNSLATPPKPFKLIDFIEYNIEEQRRQMDYILRHVL